MYDYIMFEDYRSWVAEAKELGFNERIRRSVVTPHLFSQDDRREFRLAFTARGMVDAGGSLSYCDRADPWVQLDIGVSLQGESVRYRAGRGKAYVVVIERKPGEPQVWSLSYRYKTLARGERLEDLWAELDKRVALRVRS